MTALDLFAVLGGVSIPVTVGLGVALWHARTELRIRRRLDEREQLRGHSRDADRLEHAIESIALDVERLADGQRFMARLIADRAESAHAAERPRLDETPRVITPH